MKRSSIYIRPSLSQKELELLKKDLIDHSIQVALKIKNIGFSKDQLGIIATNAVESILETYKFGRDGSLGELVKTHFFADLRGAFARAYPDRQEKVLWPDLAEKKPFDQLLEVLGKIKLLSNDTIEEIFEETNELLNGRQQKLLATVYNTPSISYAEICKQFGTRGVMTYREIRIIHEQILRTLRYLEIEF